ncbi:MAG: holo-ACP synthase [Eubacteriaceae bacterium]|nr:holo-ACP synthase [Eubacteriaceae bacterium]
MQDLPAMRIIGVGVDIVDIKRISQLPEEKKVRMARKILTSKELVSISFKISSQLLASRFAAKEAVVKAMGTGYRSFGTSSISIVHDPLGKPCVELEGNALLVAKSMGIQDFFLSISHEKETAIAFCIAVGA